MPVHPTLVLDADARKALARVQELEAKIVDLNAKITAGNEANIRSHSEHASALGLVSKGFDTATRSVGFFLTSVLSIQSGIELVKQLDEALKNIALKAESSYKSMISLAAMMPESESAKAVKAAQALGASQGIDRGTAGQQFQDILAMDKNNFAQAMKDMIPIFQLQRLGIDPKSALDASMYMGPKGLSPLQASTAGYALGQYSKRDPSEIFPSFFASAAWEDPYAGMAAVPAMIEGGIPVQQTAVRVQRLGELLKGDSPFIKKASQWVRKQTGQDFDFMGDMEKLTMLREYLGDPSNPNGLISWPSLMRKNSGKFWADLENKGQVPEKREAQALAAILNEFTFMQNAYRIAQTAPPDLLQQALIKGGQDPWIRQGLSSEQFKAINEFNLEYGPVAAKASDRRNRLKRWGAVAAQEGQYWAVDQETGELNWPGRLIRGFDAISTPEYNMYGQHLEPMFSSPGVEQSNLTEQQKTDIVLQRATRQMMEDAGILGFYGGPDIPIQRRNMCGELDGSYADGVFNIGRDSNVRVHKGESIIPSSGLPADPDTLQLLRQIEENTRPGGQLSGRMMNPDRNVGR